MNDSTAQLENFNTVSYQQKSFFSKKKIVLLITSILIVFFSLPFITYAAIPGDFFYSLKRFGEKFDSIIVFQPDLSATVQAYFSQRRIDEAIILSTKLDKQTANQQVQNTKVILSLLEEYSTIADQQLPTFTKNVEKGLLPPQWATDFFQKVSLHEYVELENLRLIAPPDVQGKILHAEAVTQESLALLADAQNSPPVSAGDVREFTTFVTTGFISQSEMESILSAKNNRELYNTIVQKVNEGVLPATAIPSLSYDEVQKYLPNDYQSFRSDIEFNELRKIILLTLIIDPTEEQKARIQQYLQTYTIGKPLPTDDIRPYVASLIYGIGLSTETDTILKNINPKFLTPSRREIYAIWLHVSKEGLTTKEAFTQLFELSNAEISHDSSLLNRIQLEGLNALKENVVYLAFPPGWTKDMVLQVRDTFPIRIALLKKTEERNALAQKLSTDLIHALSALSTPFTNSSIEAARLSFQASVFSFEQNLITSSYTPQYTQQILNQQIETLQKTFAVSLNTLKKSNNSEKELTDLEKSVSTTITDLHSANTDLQMQQTEEKDYYNTLQTNTLSINAMQDQYNTQLSNLLKTTPTYVAQLSYATLKSLTAKNSSLLQDAFTAFTTSHSELQKQIALSSIASYQQSYVLQQNSSKLSSENADAKKQIQQIVGDMQIAADTAQKDLANIALTFDTRFHLFLQGITDSHTLLLQQITISPLTGSTIGETLSSAISQQNDIGSTIAAQLQDIKTFQSSLATLRKNQNTSLSQIVLSPSPSTLTSFATTLTQSQQVSQKQIDILNSEWSSLPASFSFNASDFDKTKKALEDHLAKLANQLDLQYRQYKDQLDADIQHLQQTTNQEIIRLQQKAKDLQKDLENKTPIQVDTTTTVNTPTPGNNPTPTAIQPTPTLPGNSGSAPGHNK